MDGTELYFKSQIFQPESEALTKAGLHISKSDGSGTRRKDHDPQTLRTQTGIRSSSSSLLVSDALEDRIR